MNEINFFFDPAVGTQGRGTRNGPDFLSIYFGKVFNYILVKIDTQRMVLYNPTNSKRR